MQCELPHHRFDFSLWSETAVQVASPNQTATPVATSSSMATSGVATPTVQVELEELNRTLQILRQQKLTLQLDLEGAESTALQVEEEKAVLERELAHGMCQLRTARNVLVVLRT